MNDEEITYYLHQLHTKDAEHAYFALITHTVAKNILKLIQAYHAETNAKVQADLVEIIWQHQIPETVEFLVQALQHPSPEVWKNALDGIVAIGTGKSALVLAAEKGRLMGSIAPNTPTRLEWINEAIQQLSEE